LLEIVNKGGFVGYYVSILQPVAWQWHCRSHQAKQLCFKSYARPTRSQLFMVVWKNACSGIWHTPPRWFNWSPPNSVNIKLRLWGC